MNSKQLTNINRFKKATLPILEMARIDADSVTVCNLSHSSCETIFYITSHNTDVSGTVCIPVESLVKIARKYDISHISDAGRFKAELQTSAGAFNFRGEDPAEFPIVPELIPGTSRPLKIKAVEALKDYTSTDSLRPAMCGIYFEGETAVATDGHRLKWIDCGTDIEFILPNGVIKLLTQDEYKIGRAKLPGSDRPEYMYLASETETLIFKSIDEKYPNWRAVVPTYEDSQALSLHRADTLRAAEAAIIGGNNVSKQVQIVPDGMQVYLYSEDLNLSSSYRSEYIGSVESVRPDGSAFRIGCNAGYLIDILKDLKDLETVNIQMTSANRAMLINGNILLTPIMLSAYV